MTIATGSRRLAALMGVAMAVLAGAAVVLVGGIWGMLYLFMDLTTSRPALGATVCTLLVFGLVVAIEERGERRDRFPVTRATPDGRLDRISTRVAHQLQCPVPDRRVIDRQAPIAMAGGVRRDHATLTVSRGTLEALDDAELEAVIAHELAHVANRDAAVLTVLSAPVALADGLSDRLTLEAETTTVTVVPVALAVLCEWIGRIVVAIVGRERERVADRAAARVTGSPAALARALRTLDERVEEVPDRDLRSVGGESARSIVPLADPTEPIMRGPAGDRTPVAWPLRKRFRVWTRSHPPTDERIATLRAMAADTERV